MIVVMEARFGIEILARQYSDLIFGGSMCEFALKKMGAISKNHRRLRV